MMLIETYVASSKIQGLGLFASGDVAAGTRIWRLDPGFDLVLTEEKLKSLPQFQQQYFIRYCYKYRGFYFYCVDNARFMNHSLQPNTFEKPDGTYALRDIRKDEEILCNYATMGETPEDLKHNMDF